MTGPVRRRRPLRALAGAVLVLALLAAAGLAGAAAIVQGRLDPVALGARIERDMLRQTGRTLTLDRLRVRLLPVPAIEAEDLALGNWPRGARSRMATAARLRAHLALLPLLRHVVRLEGVTLTRPDIVLERAADGTANWQMRAQARPAEGEASAGGGARWRIEVGSVRLLDGAVAWTDARGGWSGAVDGVRLEASGLAGQAPSASLSGRHGGAGFEASIGTGALSRLDGGDGPRGAPWPVRIAAAERRDGRIVGRIGVTGIVADPGRLRGYVLDVEAQAARLEAVDALFPHAGLPPVADLRLRARLADAAPPDAAAGRPRIESLDLRTNGFEISRLPGLGRSPAMTVDRFSLAAPGRDAPLAATLDGRWRRQGVRLRGTMGTLAGWQDAARAGAGAWGPLPMALDLVAGDAHGTVEGGVGTTSDLRMTVAAPALRTVLPDGPDLTGVTGSGRVRLQPGRMAMLSDLTLESHELGLAGSATLVARAHPALTAAVTVAHADGDRLWAGWHGPDPVRPAATAPGPAVPSGDGAADGGDGAVPFAALRLADLAVRLDGRHLRLGGGDYDDLRMELALHDGTLTLAPVSLAGPAGPIAGSLVANAADRSLTLAVRPSIVPAETVAALLGQPAAARGATELVADLTAVGGTVRTLLASLTGRAGASMVGGEVDGAVLARLLGPVPALRGGLGGLGGGGGRVALRCLALPARIAGGVATVTPLELQTSRVEVTGHGTVRLADGALDLHLLPHVLIGATGASIPVHLGGTLDAPRAGLDPAAPGGRFALVIGPAGPAADGCGAALAAARFGAPGPMPGPEAATPRKGPKGLDILRGLGLFR